ncbi:MAG: hypothetical protein ACKVLC_01935 [Phycisphaerales bacterium]|jgi:hypothetical protein|tara:strand:- start:536 stop:1237 length:702 start_codon:yes stop_codon:yes gene_type:complete
MQEEHPNARVLGQLVYTDISIDVEKIPAKIVIEQFEKDLDIDMNVYWATDTKKGLQEDALITLSLQNKPALVILERVLAQMTDNQSATWQLRHGVLDVGLKLPLATRTAQLESYYIRDVLFKVRNFTAPELGTFDGDGDGGGVEDDPSSEEEEIEKIIDLIRTFVEPDLWEENGGPCSITNYKKTLLVNAPDFVHRQISGYEYEARMPIDARRRRVQYNGATVRIIVNRIPLP